MNSNDGELMKNRREDLRGCDLYLLAQIRESFGRVTYSHKTQEKQADIYFRKYRWQQGLLVALTALSSGTFLVALIGVAVNPDVSNLATSFVAVLVTGLTLAAATFNFREESDLHRLVAAQLWDVRELYQALIADVMSSSISVADARVRRDELQKATLGIYVDAPRTSGRAYEKARRGIRHNEEITFSSQEIDLLLPAELRINESQVNE